MLSNTLKNAVHVCYTFVLLYFQNEYLGLVDLCMNFANELMDLCRGTQEVEAVLSESGDATRRDPLARLKQAIRYDEKKVPVYHDENCIKYLVIEL